MKGDCCHSQTRYLSAVVLHHKERTTSRYVKVIYAGTKGETYNKVGCGLWGVPFPVTRMKIEMVHTAKSGR